MKSFNIKRIYTLLILILIAFNGFSGKNSVSSVLWKPDMAFTGYLVISDPMEAVFNNWTTSSVDFEYSRIQKVRLFWDFERTSLKYDDEWSYKIQYRISYFDDVAGEYVQFPTLETLEINDLENLKEYEAINIHHYDYDNLLIEIVDVEVLVDGTPVEDPDGSLLIPDEIGLEFVMENEYFRELNYDYLEFTIGIDPISANYISWDVLPGAEEYELEWVFIDDYSGITPAGPAEAFISIEPVRVNVRSNVYFIDLNYPKGVFYYRVRGVGKYFENDFLKSGDWVYCQTSHAISTTPFADKNISFSAVYTEDGKSKRTASYMDGSLRSRQEQINLSTDNNTLVQETKYDYEGRPVVTVMPAPVNSNNLLYKQNFNMITDGGEIKNFEKNYFDGKSTTLPLNESYGAAKYYSPSNDFTDEHSQVVHNRDYTPDADGYVYSQVEYTSDNTGRVVRTNAPGSLYKKDSDQEIRYYYATPTQTELNILFGGNVGNATHYKKVIEKDPNSQYTALYYDMAGNMIAKMLIGNVPLNLITLNPEATDDEYTFSLNGNNIVSPDGKSSISECRLFNDKENAYYEFNYEFKSGDDFEFSYTDGGSNVHTSCYTCEYDLEISVLDVNNDPVSITVNSTNYSNGIFTDHLSAADAIPIPPYTCPGGYTANKSYNIVFDIEDIGTFTIVKKLIVATDDIEQDIEGIVGSVFSSTPFGGYASGLEGDYLNSIDSSSCDITCEQTCITNVINENIQDLNQQQNVPDISDYYSCYPNCSWNTEQTDYFEAQLEICVSESCGWAELDGILPEVTGEGCSIIYDRMIKDVSPNGEGIDDDGFHFAESYISNPDNFWYRVKAKIADNTFQFYYPDGITLIAAENVMDIKNLDNWRDEWAESLITVHREYCQYRKCLASEESEVFAMELSYVNTWTDAYNNGYLNPFNVEVDYQVTILDASGLTTTTEDVIFDDTYDCTGTPDINLDPWYCVEYNVEYPNNDVDILTDRILLYNYSESESLWEYIENNYNTTTYPTLTLLELDQLKWQVFRSIYLGLKEQRILEVFNCETFDDENTIVNDLHTSTPPQDGGYGGSFDSQWYLDQYDLINGEHDCQITVDSWYQDMYFNFSDEWLTPTDSAYIREFLLQYCDQICQHENPLYLILSEDLSSEPLSYVQSHLSSQSYSWDLSDIASSAATNYEQYSTGTGEYDYYCICHDYRDLLDFINQDIIIEENSNWIYTGTIMNNYHFSATTDAIIGKYDATPGSSDIIFEFWADLGTGFQKLNIADIERIYRPTHTAFAPDGISNFKEIKLKVDIEVDNGGTPEIEAFDCYVTGSANTAPPCVIAKECSYYQPVESWGYDLDPTEYHNDCVDQMIDATMYNFDQAMHQIEMEIVNSFLNSFESGCSGFDEDFSYVYTFPDQYIELYYYDQAGNLVQSVMPQGVHILTPTQIANNNLTTAHDFLTTYTYNAINQVAESQAPDLGTSKMTFDELGRIIQSKNQNQINDGGFSYIYYDNQGRTIEAGQEDVNGDRADIVKTYYDDQFDNTIDLLFRDNEQKNLRGRVVSAEKDENGDYEPEFASLFSYDLHGNVEELVQADLTEDGIGKKKLEYKYDLVSGKVTELAYQTGNTDQFFHKYEYDADNRLTNVYTSEDNAIWSQDAKYYYYLHGTLARVEIGNYKVQGLDYAYNQFGWMMGMNSNTLYSGRDIGKDGNPTNELLGTNANNIHSRIAKDEVGFSLDYFNDNGGDYKSIRNISASDFFLAQNTLEVSNHNLYNGNIGQMVTAINYFDEGKTDIKGTTYEHDQLNRIRKTHQYDVDRAANSWDNSSETKSYGLNLDYDRNGNIKWLKRNDYTNSSTYGNMDTFTYNYTVSGTNLLMSLDETVSTSGSLGDIVYDQAYSYDDIGNLVTKTENSETTTIDWTIDKKVRSVTQTSTSLPDLQFKYDAFGNRVKKLCDYPVTDETTYYVLDAQGNILADYTKTSEQTYPYLNSYYIYGSSRLGMIAVNKEMSTEEQFMGYDNYEFEKAAQGSCQLEIVATGTVQNPSVVLKVDGTSISGNGVSWLNKTSGSQALVNAVNNYVSSPIDYKSEIDSISGDTVYIKFYTNENTGDANEKSVSLYGGGTAVVMPELEIVHGVSTPLVTQLLQYRQYEIANHLGNVLTTVSDVKYPVDSDTDGDVDYYSSLVMSASDYDPFGSLQPIRNYSANTYRFGFQGQEAENEIAGQTGSHSFFKYRISDNRIGRFFAVDPLAAKYPFYSPYSFSGNRVIDMIELEGAEPTRPEYLWKITNWRWANNGEQAAIYRADGWLVYAYVNPEGRDKYKYYNFALESWIDFTPTIPKSFREEVGECLTWAKFGEFIADIGHDVLDLAGAVPVVGEVFDGINAVWYYAEGDVLNGSLSLAGMVPLFGVASLGVKYGVKLSGKYVDNIDDFYKAVTNLSFAERKAKYLEFGREVTKQNGWIKNNKLIKKNGGKYEIYTDPKDGKHYSLDTQHGHFEVCNRKGEHQGSVDFGGKKKDGPQTDHNIIVK